MENQTTNSSVFDNNGPQQSLPNATAVLVLGIISIVGCFCYGLVGTICGIIALVLASKDNARYLATPHMFTPASYSNLRGGRVCAIIGLIISSLYLIFMIVIIAAIGFAGLSHPQDFFQHLNH